MELKSRKNVLCLIVVGLLNLCICRQSDITGMEMRGVFGDLLVSRFLQSGEEENQCGWCVVLSFTSLSLSWNSSLRTVVCLLLICSAVEKFVFYIIFLFWSDQIGFSLFFMVKVTDWLKNYFWLFIYLFFWQNSSTFCYALIPYREMPFFHFEESLSTNNIQGMLLWVLVAILILCVW